MTAEFYSEEAIKTYRDSSGIIVRRERMSEEERRRYDIFAASPEVIGMSPKRHRTNGDSETFQRSTFSTDFQLMLLTSVEGSTPTGYLVPAYHGQQKVWQALRVMISLEEGEKTLDLAAGFASRNVLQQQTHEVIAKQTPRQNWLSVVWRQAQQYFVSEPPEKTHQSDFHSLRHISCEEVLPSSLWRLACMLLQPRWRSGGVSLPAQRADLKELELPSSNSESAYHKLLNDMCMEQATNRLYQASREL